MQTAATRITPTVMHNLAHEVPFILPLPIITHKIATHMDPRPKSTRHALPSAWYRAGTSKGLFIQRQHLPADQSTWSRIILSAMGSQDGDAKQLNGLGGGTSTTSKVAIIEKSTRKGIDVEYTFIQVVPDSGKVDMTGNCGNIASGVGPYALDEGIIIPPPGQDKVKITILNTNTNKILEANVQLDSDGRAYEQGHYLMPGLRSEGSPIEVSFLNPAGSMTGKTLPTGRAEDWLNITSAGQSFSVRATMIDVANPFVLVDATTLPGVYHHGGAHASESLRIIEDIRRTAAVMMGLAKDTTSAGLTRGTPKIAVLSTPTDTSAAVFVTAFSTGRVHPSVQLTGAVCIAAAGVTPGTVAWELGSRRSSRDVSPSASQSPSSSSSSVNLTYTGKHEDVASPSCRKVTVAHASGQIEAEVACEVDVQKGQASIDSVSITRTARRLFEGNVFYDL